MAHCDAGPGEKRCGVKAGHRQDAEGLVFFTVKLERWERRDHGAQKGVFYGGGGGGGGVLLKVAGCRRGATLATSNMCLMRRNFYT